MYRRIAVLVIFLFSLSLSAANAQNAWVAKDGGIKNAGLRTAVISGNGVFIATRNALYKAEDVKERWESVFSLPGGGNNEINCVAARAQAIFIGTRRGLFRSKDYGATWKKVFKTILPDKNNITCIELSRHNSSKILIGTERGIYLSEDMGDKWRDISGVLKNVSVRCLALNREIICSGTGSGLYVRHLSSNGWERVFVSSPPEKNESEESNDTIDIEYETDRSIRSICIADNRVYIAFYKKIFYSDDKTKTWNKFFHEGLKGEINYILIPSMGNKIYCATTKGVFEFLEQKSRWFELYKGITKSLNVSRLLEKGDDKALLAVTDKGLYAFEGGNFMIDKYADIEKSIKTLKIVLDGEPTFKELQQAAIGHCDVSPEKIRNWQRDSRMKALLPKLSFGMDRNTTDLWHWEGGSTVKENDDILRPGRDSIDWDATISWDLGNLIYSDDQTNIDVRSRLMVQLRNDILDDLRRIYFERKRLQFELMANAPPDMNAKYEKELRLQELTQAIDDLTGNYFSEHMKK